MSKDFSVEEMLRTRVGRYKDLKSSAEAFLDVRLPGCEREIFNVIGPGVTEDPRIDPPIKDCRDFHASFVKAKAGCGAALHCHETIEMFMPLEGRWAFLWGDEGENEVVLDAYDVISVPPGVMRGFRNAGEGPGVLFVIVGGTDPGRVSWPEATMREARKVGLAMDENGMLVEVAPASEGGTAPAGAKGVRGTVSVSREEMERTRVARFRNLVSTPQAFVDTRLPGGERDIYMIVGRGVTEDWSITPPITDNRDFSCGIIKARPGCGAKLHAHETIEMFMPLSGRWAIIWGDEGENELVLEPYDMISVPTGVMRGFRNAGDEEALLFYAVGGTDPGKLTWPEKTLEEARKAGVTVTEDGQLVAVD